MRKHFALANHSIALHKKYGKHTAGQVEQRAHLFRGSFPIDCKHAISMLAVACATPV
jgi:hypothetical protein